MAKPLFFLHLGPEAVSVADMRESLGLGGIALPDVDDEMLEHADLEIRRAHKSADLKRKQVEGSWARICRRAFRTRSHCFVSMPGLFGATADQAALALDGLAGMKVILVIPSGFEAEPPAAWTSQVKEDRTHVLPSGLTAEQLAAQVARIALIEEQERLDKRLVKITKRRKQVNKRLAA
jgi:hypothetical protein